MRNTGGMLMTGKNRSTCRKTCPPATLTTRSPTKTELVSNPCLRGENSATVCLRLGTALDCVFPHLKQELPAIFWSPFSGKTVKETCFAMSIKDSWVQKFKEITLLIWMKFLSEHFASFMSDFTSQSTEGDRVYYSWVFRGLQFKDSRMWRRVNE
jgi:hypothetical protein